MRDKTNTGYACSCGVFVPLSSGAGVAHVCPQMYPTVGSSGPTFAPLPPPLDLHADSRATIATRDATIAQLERDNLAEKERNAKIACEVAAALDVEIGETNTMAATRLRATIAGLLAALREIESKCYAGAIADIARRAITRGEGGTKP